MARRRTHTVTPRRRAASGKPSLVISLMRSILINAPLSNPCLRLVAMIGPAYVTGSNRWPGDLPQRLLERLGGLAAGDEITPVYDNGRHRVDPELSPELLGLANLLGIATGGSAV